VTTEQYLDAWGDLILRQYVLDVVKAFSRDACIQEALLKEAWFSVDKAGPDRTTECYIEIAFDAMLHYHKMIQREGKRWGKSATYKRVRRARLRFFIHRITRKKDYDMGAGIPQT
jgi:hypothetical protein